MAYSVHERLLPKNAGLLIDELGTPGDRVWPGQGWPPLRLDRPLAVGAGGGHGPRRYTVGAYLHRGRMAFPASAARSGAQRLGECR